MERFLTIICEIKASAPAMPSTPFRVRKREKGKGKREKRKGKREKRKEKRGWGK